MGPTGGREVKGTIAKMALSYVRRALGEEGVAEVLATAGRQRFGTTLAEPASWTSHEDAVAIAEAAAAVCGDPDIGRRAGEELMRVTHERGTVDFMVATGSVAAAVELAANTSTKMSRGRRLELAGADEGEATIVGSNVDVTRAHPFYCGYTAGYFGLIPQIFGHAGVITEPECISRGDTRCVFRLRWTVEDAGAHVDVDAIDASRELAESFVARFEQLHTMATELAGAEGVDALLDRITERAGIAVDAHSYLLVVHADDDTPRIHHRGFTDDHAAARFAERLVDGEQLEDQTCVVAEVASGGRSHGRLAARYPPGSTVTEMERRLLEAYARHAAGAIEAVHSLEGARRDRDTAQALLSLAQELAAAGSQDEVARRLLAAVPAVTGSKRAGVWLWDPSEGCLRRQARSWRPDEEPIEEQRVLYADRVPLLAAMVESPAPVVLNPATAGPDIAHFMEGDEMRRSVAVPMVAREELLGVVVAGFDDARVGERPDVDRDLFDRLRGMADQAATALDNAGLLERVRHQALHDPLTDLPNRTLVADRARQALREIGRSSDGASLLFVDLDNFKGVNDTLGHEAGDDLVGQVAGRLAACLRRSDTAARVGGDEFVVLLPDTPDPSAAASVAESVVVALARPFVLGGRRVDVTASVGVASAAHRGEDYDTLLRRADTAMYRAKQSGGSGYAVDAPALGHRPVQCVAPGLAG